MLSDDWKGAGNPTSPNWSNRRTERGTTKGPLTGHEDNLNDARASGLLLRETTNLSHHSALEQQKQCLARPPRDGASAGRCSLVPLGRGSRSGVAGRHPFSFGQRFCILMPRGEAIVRGMPMSFKMECPHCKRTLNVTEKAFGKTVPCPGCNQPVTVPYKPPALRPRLIPCQEANLSLSHKRRKWCHHARRTAPPRRCHRECHQFRRLTRNSAS